MEKIKKNVLSTISEQKRNFQLLDNYEKLISEDCAILISDQIMYKKELESRDFNIKNIQIKD